MSNIIEICCEECDEFDIDDFEDDFEDEITNNSLEDLLEDLTLEGENFLHILMSSKTYDYSNIVMNSIDLLIQKNNPEDLAKMFLSKNNIGETPIHYLLDRSENVLSKVESMIILDKILDSLPFDKKIELLSMKENELFESNGKGENIAMFAMEINDEFFDQDKHQLFSMNNIESSNEETLNKLSNMLKSIDSEDGETLYLNITEDDDNEPSIENYASEMGVEITSLNMEI